MRRLFAALALVAIMAAPVGSQTPEASPTVPPLQKSASGEAQSQPLVVPAGESQLITPPVPVNVPTTAPNTNPIPDTLEPPKFSIVAMIGKTPVDSEVVALPIGRMLRLTLTGSVATETQAAVTWSSNRTSEDFSDVNEGRYCTFCAPEPGVWLFTASINNPEPLGRAVVAQRWVVVGGVVPDTPPPVVDPNVPPAPVPPVVVTPGFRALLLYEAKKGMPDAYASPDVAAYLNSHCAKSADGVLEWRRPDITDKLEGDYDTITALRSVVPAGVEQWVVIGANGRVAYSDKPPQDDDGDGAELLALLKKHGG